MLIQYPPTAATVNLRDDDKPEYGLCCVVDDELYIVTWTHETRERALDTVFDWAIDTGGSSIVWYQLFAGLEDAAETLRRRKRAIVKRTEN